MKIIKVKQVGGHTHHGIAYTEHDGYGGTSDNRWPVKLAIETELRAIYKGETYRLVVNGVDKGEFTKE